MCFDKWPTCDWIAAATQVVRSRSCMQHGRYCTKGTGTAALCGLAEYSMHERTDSEAVLRSRIMTDGDTTRTVQPFAPEPSTGPLPAASSPLNGAAGSQSTSRRSSRPPPPAGSEARHSSSVVEWRGLEDRQGSTAAATPSTPSLLRHSTPCAEVDWSAAVRLPAAEAPAAAVGRWAAGPTSRARRMSSTPEPPPRMSPAAGSPLDEAAGSRSCVRPRTAEHVVS